MRNYIVKIGFAILFALVSLFAVKTAYSQVPDAINFQAIARDVNGEILSNTQIMLQLSILDGSAEGTQVYREVRTLTTNAYGSFSFQIGRGASDFEGDFSAIDWSASDKFIKIDYDPSASSNFELSLGTIEFVTVPYAFTARDVVYIDANEATDGDMLIFNATSGKFEPGQVNVGSVTWENVQGKPTDLNDFTNEAGYLKTETQTLSDVLSINNSANSQKITDLANPDNAQDAATKAYVDQLSSSFDLLLNLLEDNGMVVVDFSANLTNIWLGNSISFTDNSILQANQWNWDFGDGTSSSEQNPSHIYTTGGTYSVSLTVSNGALNSTKTKNDHIVVADYETFTDIRDGKIYKKVQIGSQTWMAENLAYAPSSGNYWAYNNNDLNVETYGYLYDWNTAMNNEVSSNTNPSGVQGICPAGWHLPSNAEWTQLTNFLGENAGGKLKETGTVHWDNPNEGATNEYGFTARPGGYYLNGYSFKIGENGYWWSTTENNSDNAWIRILAANGNDAINANLGKNFGLSVRCVKN